MTVEIFTCGKNQASLEINYILDVWPIVANNDCGHGLTVMSALVCLMLLQCIDYPSVSDELIMASSVRYLTSYRRAFSST